LNGERANEMTDCDLDTAVPDWVVEHPVTLAVFQALGIDYCCGGKSLATACRERGMDALAVLAELRHRIGAGESPSAPALASIQVGLPRQYGEAGAADPLDQPWTSGFYKEPVRGPVRLGPTNLDGDRQADRVHHGGPDKAVLAYAADHYVYWRVALRDPALPFGAFGENFTVAGLTEADVCIGDVWKVGPEAVVQVSQPRQPCWKLARRWRVRTLAAQVQRTGRTGWYFRVVTGGAVAAGMPLALLDRPHPDWPVERANRVMHAGANDPRATAELAALPLLAASWRTTLAGRVGRPGGRPG
jgi:MOSC domain-containing protein YiiM